MSSLDLDQVLYARAGWRKVILVPLWTFQIAVLLCLMGIFAYRLAETFEHYEELDKMGEVPIVEVVWEATNVGFNLIALVLNIVEIARKATERLTPFTMVFTHVLKLTLAFAVLALDIVAYLQRMDGHYSTIGLSLDCGAANLITFTYSLITYRKQLKYEEYRLTANTKAQVYAGDESLELGYHPKHGHRSGGITTTRTTELHYSDNSTSSYPSQPQTQPSTGSNPSPSGSVLKKEVDRAMGAEFGWSTPPPHRSHHSDSNHSSDEAVNRSGSVVVASGKVPVHHGGLVVAAPVEGGLQRQQSWVTEQGVVAEEDGEGVMGRGGEAGGHYSGQGGSGSGEEDEEALLPGK
ncbi:hypothetical protein C8A01DRAFT_32923 [Parachaetomium inaequale]|uniref:Uncharacterized protein n=1 Tax=Parachaetomium inaequale TaxID=2588326 RepID=A0AAN6STX8_9PEZI|nr:hypothetical protein C8A01DRAFT_32923 [Parachaetomium inaequale]